MTSNRELAELLNDAIARGEVYVHVRGTLRQEEDIAVASIVTVDGSGDLIVDVEGDRP